MDTDLTRAIGAVTRSIENCEREGRQAKLLVAERSYDTSPEDLWDALTNAERLPRWFLPISGDLRPGGRYQLEGNAGGEVLRCEPPTLLEVTWEFGGDISWLTVQLTAERTGTSDGTSDGAATRLELRHVAPVPDEMWDQFGPGAVGIGWDLALLGLDRHLTSGAAVDPEAAAAWAASPEGIVFMGGSGDGWRDASITAGTDPDAAAGAAQRTFAFYTGAEPTS